MADLQEQFAQLFDTNMTKTTHRNTYPALSTSRPELNQAGRAVLITGGGTGVGFSIARSFVRASADIVVIIGRRSDVITKAGSSLEQEAKVAGTKTTIIARTCDASNTSEVEALWKDLAERSIIIDVYVANAAKFSEPKTIFELGADEVWSQVEVNAKSPLYFAEKFNSQQSSKQKFIVNVTSQVVSQSEHAGVAARPAYTISKTMGSVLFQSMALNVSPEEIQIINFHPGLICNETWKAMGLAPDFFDNDQLCGDFAVWATSKEAKFLHGRSVWASWDVEELSTEECEAVEARKI